jgi:hypothetical protein
MAHNEKLAKSEHSSEAANGPAIELSRPKPVYAHVDRLIELASDRKPAEITASAAGNNSQAKDSKETPMWKILLQLKPFLPYLARLVPLLDIAVGPAQNAGLANEVRQAIAKIQTTQRDMSATVTTVVRDQSLQLARLEEELIRLREASDAHAEAQAKLAQDLQSAARFARIAASGLGILLVALIVMTGILLARIAH